jgi:hypothetical protein
MPDDVLDVAEAPWRERLGGDPLPWLLETKAPAVRAATLTRLLDRPNEPGFECAANEGFSCAWGAIKELSGLALILREQRSPAVQEAIEVGVEFLFSRDPAVSDYPMGDGDAVPSRSWVKLGFPSEYVADVLQNLEVLAHLGYAKDPDSTPPTTSSSASGTRADDGGTATPTTARRRSTLSPRATSRSGSPCVPAPCSRPATADKGNWGGRVVEADAVPPQSLRARLVSAAVPAARAE